MNEQPPMPSAATPTIPVRFLDAGDSAVIVEFGDGIDPKINAHVLALDAKLNASRIVGLVETVPTYRSLMVQVDPLVFDRDGFETRVRCLLPTLNETAPAGKRWRVPVVYGGDFGIDLKDVAERHGLSSTQVIDRHAAAIYRVYMIGFMPGYTYLGGLDQTIATPRRLDPRPKTPAGTISIGGIQALVAGGEMPSGWHLLGRTPVVTFMARRAPPVLFEPGDEIQFQPIDASRWTALSAAAAAGHTIAEVIAA
jgi:KipI family sensor histidine kinase inhibitor